MKVKSMVNGVVLFPGESEKWYTSKYDFIYIKSDHAVAVRFNRIQVALTEETPGLFQCSHGPFSIQNNGTLPVTLQGIKFTSGIKMQKDFYSTDFEPTPFAALLTGESLADTGCSHITEMLEHIQKPQPPQPDRSRIDSRLIQINRYIRKNYASLITLQDLADSIGVHPTYLSNTYSKVFNVSPIYYLNQLRMKAAQQLLGNTELTLKEIALSIGYGSVSQFCLIFKRFHSKTPSEYRQTVLDKSSESSGDMDIEGAKLLIRE